MEISQFLNERYSESALYLSFRALPSYIDGLKNAARKTVYTVKKRNIKSEMKVSALGSAVVEEAEYLHGDTSIQGTIVTMSKGYCGANNLPILEGIGSFGTRMVPDAAAPRYIFSRPSKYFNNLFNPADDANLHYQQFEGNSIEPTYYVPTLPLVLINGTKGIGVGFKGDICARPVKNIIKLLRNSFAGKRVDEKLLLPGWQGFTGTVRKLEDNKFEVRGVAEINDKKVTITELPITYSLADYLGLLRKLRDNGTIDKFTDYSESTFKFEIKLSPEEAAKTQEQIFNDLGLVETYSEIPVCIDENNAIREFKNAKEIYEAYYKIKTKSLEARIKSEIKRLEAEEALQSEIVKFIAEVLKGTIVLKEKRALLEGKMKAKGYVNIDKLLALPLYSLNADKAKEIKDKHAATVKELAAMKKETPATLWEKDLEVLEKEIA